MSGHCQVFAAQAAFEQARGVNQGRAERGREEWGMALLVPGLNGMRSRNTHAVLQSECVGAQHRGARTASASCQWQRDSNSPGPCGGGASRPRTHHNGVACFSDDAECLGQQLSAHWNRGQGALCAACCLRPAAHRRTCRCCASHLEAPRPTWDVERAAQELVLPEYVVVFAPPVLHPGWEPLGAGPQRAARTDAGAGERAVRRPHPRRRLNGLGDEAIALRFACEGNLGV